MIDKIARWEGGVPEVVEMWAKSEEAMLVCKEGEVEGVTSRGSIELVI